VKEAQIAREWDALADSWKKREKNDVESGGSAEDDSSPQR
jgi:hypothetical protein